MNCHPHISLSKLNTRTGGETPQRRRSEDSLFADEDIPNKTMPWEENTAPSALPWDKPAATPATRTPAPGTPANRTPGPGTPVEQPPGTPAVRTPLPWDNKTLDTPQVNMSIFKDVHFSEPVQFSVNASSF